MKKILIRLPNWIGDVVMATPAIRAVRAGFPGAEVAVMAPALALAMLRGSPSFDRAIVAERTGGALGPWREGRMLARERFDAAILLPNSWSSALAAFLARIPRRFGYDNDGRGVLLTDRLRVKRRGRLRPIPMDLYYLRLCALAGCGAGDRRLELPVSPGSEARASAWLAAHGIAADEKPIAFNVGANFGPSKLWTVEGWAAVADHFLRAGRRVVVYGGPNDRATVDAVLSSARVKGALAATDVAIEDLCAHMRRAALLVSTDSGGRHFGAAAGIPVVVIMGPTHPNYTEIDSDRTVVLLEKVECWPCHLRRCPIDHRCMTRIGPERVIAAAEAFLAGRHPFGGARPWVTRPGQEDALWALAPGESPALQRHRHIV